MRRSVRLIGILERRVLDPENMLHAALLRLGNEVNRAVRRGALLSPFSADLVGRQSILRVP